MADAPTFGRTLLAAGPESFFVDRAVEEWRARVRKAAPEAQVSEVQAADLDAGKLAELTGGSLFSEQAALVVHDLSLLPEEMTDLVVALAKDTPPETALALTFPGGNRNRGIVDKLKKAKVEVTDAAKLSLRDLPDFVMREARRLGVRIPRDAVEALIDGVGNDPRALSAAVGQLLSDAGDEPLSGALVRRYFAGRAEISSFTIADDVFNGATAPALAKLRWALSTGVAPVLITSALASGLRSLGRYNGLRSSGMNDKDLAAAIGAPGWKMRDIKAQARRWNDRRIADGIRLVAQADADVKGQAGSPDFTLERLVLRLASS